VKKPSKSSPTKLIYCSFNNAYELVFNKGLVIKKMKRTLVYLIMPIKMALQMTASEMAIRFRHTFNAELNLRKDR